MARSFSNIGARDNTWRAFDAHPDAFMRAVGADVPEVLASAEREEASVTDAAGTTTSDVGQARARGEGAAHDE